MGESRRRVVGLRALMRPGPLLVAALAPYGLAAVPDAVAQGSKLEVRIAALEAQLTELKQEHAEAGKARADGRGAAITSADGAYRLALSGVVHGDARIFLNDDAATDTMLLRRVRPTLTGQLGERVSFRVTPELAGSSATLLDAWADVRLGANTQLRAGQFKSPVSLERLVSATSLPLAERGFGAEVAGNRDTGVQLQGTLRDGAVSYAAGIFNGGADGRNAASTNPDDKFEFAGRLFFEPWRADSDSPLRGLGFGVAGSFGKKEGAGNDFLPRYRSPGQQQISGLRSSVAADGDHVRLSPQASFYRGPFGLLTEYITSRQALTETVSGANDKLTHRAWNVLASWVLTGEAASYRGPSPRSDFSLGAGGAPGAWEVVVRAAGLDLDDDAFPTFAYPTTAVESADTVALGMNWYLSPNAKVALNFQHTRFDGGGSTDRKDEDVLLSRLQVAF